MSNPPERFFMPIALIAFIVVPIVEMIILIEVGGIIGALPTVGLVVLTATLGIWLLRLEGTATLARVQARLDRGELPETELLEGIMLLIGGALLLTPGFVTDTIGFACILPGLRRPIARWIIRRGVLGYHRRESAIRCSKGRIVTARVDDHRGRLHRTRRRPGG
ncbi:MAG: FxsA family protein [Gammaproteobacteria bacterium]|nr:FxsA family protein [Gammaproteobacteria bacterium]